MPKISVIVPIYNVEPYIKECMNSLMEQTLYDIEIICVDDCGADNSMKFVHELAEKDNRIKIIRNEQNSGLSQSRNNGMKVATAKYIMFCDSDDWFATDMCEKMYNAMQKSKAELGIFGFEVIYEANHDRKASDDRYFALHYDGVVDATSDVLDKHAVCACGKIYCRDIIEKHDLQFPYGLRHEDEFWYPAYCTWVKKVVFVQEKFYKYRRRAGSIMNKTYGKKSLNLDPLKIAIEYFNYLKKHNQVENHKNWFWGKMFFRLFGATLNYSGPKNYKPCYEMAIDFVNKNWNESDMDFDVKRKIEIVRHKTVTPRKILFGLLRIKESVEKKQIECIGIPVLRMKYMES